MTDLPKKTVEISIPFPIAKEQSKLISEIKTEVKSESLLEIENRRNSVGFKPTNLQVKWLDKAIELQEYIPTRIAKELKCESDNWYIWIKNPDFLKWWDQEWTNWRMAHRYKLMEIAFKKAEESEPILIRLMRLFGFVLPPDPEKELPYQNSQTIPQNTPPITPTIGSINIIAANIEKSAKERGISLDDSSGESPIVGQEGSAENH